MNKYHERRLGNSLLEAIETTGYGGHLGHGNGTGYGDNIGCRSAAGYKNCTGYLGLVGNDECNGYSDSSGFDEFMELRWYYWGCK